MIFFIKPNHIVPFAKPALTTRDMNFDELYVLGYVQDEIEYTLYDDDGYTRDINQPEHFHKIYASKEYCDCKTKKVQYR